MSKIEVDAIDKQSGSTLTLGGSGTAVTLACGATQTGFGRTGTVDWQTGSIKTATFTAANGEGYFADTSSGAFTMNLPAGSAGAIVSVADYAGTWDTNNLTVSPNGSDKIGGTNADVTLETIGQSVTFVFVDSTQGWVNTMDSTSNVRGNAFIIASGGAITESGNDKIHTFTGPGTFTVCTAAVCAANNLVSYMIIAGGGGGGSGGGPGGGSGAAGAGGGAGGYREVKSPSTPYTASPLDGYGTPGNRVTISTSPGSYPIVVGGGGSSTTPGNNSNEGSVSSFGGITSAGGGGGGSRCAPAENGKDGGSGGGATGSGAVGSGNTPPTTPSQGNNGGSTLGPNNGGGGGGGAGAVGAGATPGSGGGTGGNGGSGTTTSINATPTVRAGGGGGGGGGDVPSGHDNAGGTAGTGGGGTGGRTGNLGTAATDNTGGGGGAGGSNPGKNGLNGGSGIVIIRYKFQ